MVESHETQPQKIHRAESSQWLWPSPVLWSPLSLPGASLSVVVPAVADSNHLVTRVTQTPDIANGSKILHKEVLGGES